MTVTRDSLRQELKELQARMHRYELFKSQQYNTKLCDKHEFEVLHVDEMEGEAGWNISQRCTKCGLEVVDVCPTDFTTQSDPWHQFREEVGEEEE